MNDHPTISPTAEVAKPRRRLLTAWVTHVFGLAATVILLLSTPDLLSDWENQFETAPIATTLSFIIWTLMVFAIIAIPSLIMRVFGPGAAIWTLRLTIPFVLVLAPITWVITALSNAG